MEIWNRRNPVGGAPIVDSALDVNSEHCVQNKVVAEAISTINSTLQDFIITESKNFGASGRTFTSNNDYDFSADISKEGYTPIGIVSVTITGNYCSRFNVYGWYIRDTKAYLNTRFVESSSASTSNINIYGLVLYVKNN